MIRLVCAIPAIALAVTTAVAAPIAAQDTRLSAAAKFDAEFTAADTDRDGVLSRAELQARIAGMRTAGSRIDPVHARRLADLWFDRADTNKDGKVTRAEGQALLAAMMDRAARNRDGHSDVDGGATTAVRGK